MNRIRVLVADDHPSVRENLRYLLNAEADLTCIGVVKNGRQCITMCRELAPDVLVLDHDMPGLDGLTIARALERSMPEIRIVMYTLERDVCQMAEAFGASTCVMKDAPYESLLQAIRAKTMLESPVA